ncbi:MAG: general secretion pathway protein GspK [Thermoanaerobaculaceae bacterium]|nr:general secretion pathway protein GspK [Thermoanaerobaculaceae bacterium]
MRYAALVTLAVALAAPAAGQSARFLFVEPDPSAAADPLPALRPVTDPARQERLRRWTTNEAASVAAEAYHQARLVVAGQLVGHAPEPLVVAVMDGEASTDQGFRLLDQGTWRRFPLAPYVRLSEEESRWDTVLLHEAGHACLMLLASGRDLPGHRIASIPHATAALTDRTTAFSEGFATALETVLAQRAAAPAWRARYHHDELRFGVIARMLGEYFRPSGDLVGFSQSLARHQEVRDNRFAFVSAHTGPDYLRTQLDPARDLATLRDPNQLLQSEGFVASVFYGLLMRGPSPPAEELYARLGKVMRALREVLTADTVRADTPLLLEAVRAHARLVAAGRGETFSILLDLSRGVLVDAEAAALWQRHYLAALRQDLDRLEVDAINAARRRWLEATLANPEILSIRLGPQLGCTVPAVTVSLPGMGVQAPLGFDLNTAEVGVLRCVPGMSDAEVGRWLAARQQAPFASFDDFRARVALRPVVLSGLELQK